jgi:CO/xanthine dehydrogenase Mo-binding subunit
LTGRNRGRGVACGFWFNYGGRSSASAAVNTDGTVNLLIGSVDLCGTRTSTAMQLAETLGIQPEDILPYVVDTSRVGDTEGTYGSRTTFATGWAAYELGQKIIAELKRRAAELWEVEPESVDYRDGNLYNHEQKISFGEIAACLDETGGPLMVSATVAPDEAGPALACHLVDVEVDPETGKVSILRYTAAQDVGRAIQPDFVEGQIQGGVAQGIGWALNEAYMYDSQGRLLNANWLDYRMPTSLDVPMIDPLIVEVPNPGHPFGVRGVGEVSIVPPPAALANAIYQAIGIRMTRLPMSPTNILEALWQKQSEA